MTPAVFERARIEYERAIAIDPNFADAYAGLAQVWGFNYNNGWSTDTRAALKQADTFATRAVALAPAQPIAAALARRDGAYGAAVDPSFLSQLDPTLGLSSALGWMLFLAAVVLAAINLRVMRRLT